MFLSQCTIQGSQSNILLLTYSLLVPLGADEAQNCVGRYSLYVVKQFLHIANEEQCINFPLMLSIILAFQMILAAM